MRIRSLLIASVFVVACSKKKDEPPKPVDTKTEKKADVAPIAPKKIDGPSVTPVKTHSVAFVVPKDAKWWGEMTFACYRAVMTLSGTKTPGEAFEKLSPTVPAAMAVGGIDLGRDLAALGAFDCGDTPCIYAVATIEKPEKMPEVLRTLLPGAPQKEISSGHYTLETQGMKGVRTIHIRVVPLQWTSVPQGDQWIKESARATHVVFIGGVDGKNTDVDPLTKLADAQTALAKVEDTESVLTDARSRCVLGRVGATDFQPGFKLDSSRFALAAPTGKTDALMKLIGSERTLEFVVELVLSPAAKDADVKKWIQQGKAWMSQTAAPIRMQFQGNPMLDVYFDMIALLGERGFKYDLKDKALKFSWRTDRVPASDLDALEKRFQSMMGQ